MADQRESIPISIPASGLRKSPTSGQPPIVMMLGPLTDTPHGDYPTRADAHTATPPAPESVLADASSPLAGEGADVAMEQINTRLPAEVRRGLKRAKAKSGKSIEALWVEIGEKWLADGGFQALGTAPVNMTDKVRFTTRLPRSLWEDLTEDMIEPLINWNELLTRAYTHWSASRQDPSAPVANT